MKPSLTQEQKERFEAEFRKLIAEAPKEVQEKWNGLIIWSPIGDPIFEGGIPNKLTGKQADTYTILLNKLKDRRI